MPTVAWGIVGLGHVAVDCLAPAIAASAGSRLVACAGRDAEKARTIAPRIGAARSYPDHGALVADPELDIVYVATPNRLHKKAVLAAARARKHVLCEKPLALTLATREKWRRRAATPASFFVPLFRSGWKRCCIARARSSPPGNWGNSARSPSSARPR